MDGLFKRNQVSAESRFFDNGTGYESLINGDVEVGRTISSKSIPAFAGIWPGGATFLSAAFMGVQSAWVVF